MELHLPASHDFTFPATMRLKSVKAFDQLFLKGKRHWASPFEAIALEIPFDEERPLQIGFAAPKRKLKKATDRNRMKRLMRESFRLNKNELLNTCLMQRKGLIVLFISQCNSTVDYPKTQEKIKLLLQRLTIEHAQTAG